MQGWRHLRAANVDVQDLREELEVTPVNSLSNEHVTILELSPAFSFPSLCCFLLSGIWKKKQCLLLKHQRKCLLFSVSFPDLPGAHEITHAFVQQQCRTTYHSYPSLASLSSLDYFPLWKQCMDKHKDWQQIPWLAEYISVLFLILLRMTGFLSKYPYNGSIVEKHRLVIYNRLIIFDFFSVQITYQ